MSARKKPVRSRKKPEKPVEASPPPTEETVDPVEEAIERSEALAQSQLEMARLFLAKGKPDIARRRLQIVIDEFGRSDAAKEARRMLRSI